MFFHCPTCKIALEVAVIFVPDSGGYGWVAEACYESDDGWGRVFVVAHCVGQWDKPVLALEEI